jgi:hypothetical protein
MAGPLIEFICIAASHKPHHDGEHASTVTVHEGRWAYCDSPAESGHDWVTSGGVPLELLRHRRRSVESLARPA